MPPCRSNCRLSRSSSRVVLVALSIEMPLRKSCAGLNGTNSPVNCPIEHPTSASRQRAACRREHRRADRIEHAIDALTIGQRLHVSRRSRRLAPRARPHRHPTPCSASAFAADVVCAITQPPARFASCTPCMPRPPPAPVTSTPCLPAQRGPRHGRRAASCRSRTDAMAAASSATSSGTHTTLSASTATNSAYPPFNRVSPRNTCSAHSGSRPLRQ